jgi:hypothetical protein
MNGGGYGNPAAEEELRKRVRQGVVVATDGERMFRATEMDGRLRLDPIRAAPTFRSSP